MYFAMLAQHERCKNEEHRTLSWRIPNISFAFVEFVIQPGTFEGRFKPFHVPDSLEI
jgi:hypothetical protein